MNQMRKNLFFIFTLIVCSLDVILPYILGLFYPSYNHLTMVISVLGSNNSPVKIIFNLWMVVLGVSFILIGCNLFKRYKSEKAVSSTVLFLITIIYAVFDCLASSLFSVGETKEMNTLPEIIHGYGSAIGCTIFVFAGLLIAIILWKKNKALSGIVLISFALALISFVIFVACENIPDNVHGILKLLKYEGLWQRISFVFMYIPYILLSYEK